MRMPAAAVLVVLALAPRDAFADRHGMECFGSYSFTLQSLSGLTTNCGRYFDNLSLFGFSLFDRRAAGATGVQPPDVGTGDPKPYQKRLTFLILETTRMSGTHDDGDPELLRWMGTGGVRHYFPVTPSFQPSIQGLAGVAFTSTRPHGPARSQVVAGIGVGLDFEFAHTKTTDWVVRAQCDGFRISADEPEYFVRCAPGVSLRWGGR
jgi:hypothetical protein